MLAAESCMVTYKDFVDILHPNLTTVSTSILKSRNVLLNASSDVLESVVSTVYNDLQ
ncbi:hypothetical protein RO3G_11010 [Rhizopus delemar RA 99-880]|uniref:Uncharacterized protein n=1 Tax=Rhizopus delemar (strain RA 99-880 / ATCC MYA-4621 / FGSC 9543 / NRRL 43880) TaxID=246409 RepID=I1CCW9_RHIO9|nr:hypothetical protein RO3G_11010 [Rhizopus delemar RA 99-880]|eukprot:EIE86299.1 hypothetical protein RO3G_11010 [Rhizopus delemar RA 99-880]